MIQLNQQEYTAAIYRTLNQVNNPPFCDMIEKLERYRHGNTITTKNWMPQAPEYCNQPTTRTSGGRARPSAYEQKNA